MNSTIKTYPAYFTSRQAGVFQRRYGTPERQPARPTIDLFKPARRVPAARIDFAEATTVSAPGSELFT